VRCAPVARDNSPTRRANPNAKIGFPEPEEQLKSCEPACGAATGIHCGVGVRRHDFEQSEKRGRRAVASPTEPHGRRRVGGTRHMTVACDGGAGAQAGVRHRDGRTPRPYRLRRTHAPRPQFCESRPVQRAVASPSTCRSYCEVRTRRMRHLITRRAANPNRCWIYGAVRAARILLTGVWGGHGGPLGRGDEASRF
jgi:hypothetical protein